LITAIIVNWERPLDTIACIQSLQKSNLPDLNILVVDNGSTDNSISLIQNSCPSVTIIPLPKNTGYTGGFNAGINHALKTNTTHILILNNDTIVDKNALAYLCQTHWDIAVPKILFHDHPHTIWAAGARWRRFPPSVIMNGYKQPDNETYDQPIQLAYATGCVLLIKRTVFEQIGGFDPDFGSYMEDYDFCYRANQTGFIIGYVPKARILHKVSLTLGENSKQKSWYLGRNTVLFYRKQNRFSWWELWTTLLWTSIRELIKFQAYPLQNFWRGIQAGFRFLHTKTP
jgi:GT2 family glycosyltransferase